MNMFKVTLSQLIIITVAVALNKSYRSRVSVVSENGSSHIQSSNDALNRTVLRSSRNAFKDETVLTLDGREFQVHAAATGHQHFKCSVTKAKKSFIVPLMPSLEKSVE